MQASDARMTKKWSYTVISRMGWVLIAAAISGLMWFAILRLILWVVNEVAA